MLCSGEAGRQPLRGPETDQDLPPPPAREADRGGEERRPHLGRRRRQRDQGGEVLDAGPEEETPGGQQGEAEAAGGRHQVEDLREGEPGEDRDQSAETQLPRGEQCHQRAG